MRQHRPLCLWSYLLAAALCFVTAEVGAASKNKSAKRGTTQVKPTASEPADDSTVAVGHSPSKSCKAPMPSTCAPSKVTFAPAVSSPHIEDDYISALAAADMNGDGKTDLIVGHRQSKFLEVMLSKGDGTFGRGTKIEERMGGYALLAADLDGDCMPDLLTGAFPTDADMERDGEFNSRVDNTISFLAGKGDGTTRPATRSLVQDPNLFNLIPADFNADGRPDLVYSGNNYLGVPKIVLNKGNGKFTRLKTDFEDTKLFTAGDLTGDGAADLALWKLKQGSDSDLCVRANNGKAQFAPAVCYPLSHGVQVRAIAIADLNGDGKNDLVSAGSPSTLEGGTLFDVFINKGDGSLADRVSYLVPTEPSVASVTDIDGDGRPDFVVYQTGNNPSLGVLKNKGDGTFVAKSEKYSFGSTVRVTPEVFVTGDFKGNGLVGFATVDRSGHVSVITASCAP